MAHYDYDTCTELDCPLCLAINAKGIPATDPPVVELGYLVVDAVSKLNDKIDAIPAADFTPLRDEIASERSTTDAKFDSLAAAVDAKLTGLHDPTAEIAEGDAQALIDANAYTDQSVDAVRDEVFDLLARHAATGDNSVLAPVKQALDDIFAANTGAPAGKTAGHTGKKG